MKMRVTIIEDDSGIREALTLVLERAGYEITTYSDGMPILAGTYVIPDIFLIDKQLSGVDGLDICRHLKSSETTKDIPIIMMSASPHTARMAKDACADEFIEKPFKNKHLLELISKHS